MISYEEEYTLGLLFKRHGSLIPRACLFAIPSVLLSVALAVANEFRPGFLDMYGFPEQSISFLWTLMTSVLMVLLAFRTNRAMERFWEGTGLLHQMRGEWFEAISSCVGFNSAAVLTREHEVKVFRHTLVRLMSLCHRSALEEIGMRPEDPLETIDTYGLDDETLVYLKTAKEVHRFNMVEVMLHMIRATITHGHHEGLLTIPAPILSRVYQMLSRGYVNLLNAKKITDTRFPFPFAQLISLLLLGHLLLSPWLITSFTRSIYWSPLFTFLAEVGVFCINAICVELENPFGDDPNDLPLCHFQREMNNCLLMLLRDEADLVPSVSERRYLKTFEGCKDSITVSHKFNRFRVETLVVSGSSECPGRRTSRISIASDLQSSFGVAIRASEYSSQSAVSSCSKSCASSVINVSDAVEGEQCIQSLKTSYSSADLSLIGPLMTRDAVAAETLGQEGYRKASPSQPGDRLITDRVKDRFCVALQRWTEVLETQVVELSQDWVALRTAEDVERHHSFGPSYLPALPLRPASVMAASDGLRQLTLQSLASAEQSTSSLPSSARLRPSGRYSHWDVGGAEQFQSPTLLTTPAHVVRIPPPPEDPPELQIGGCICAGDVLGSDHVL